MPSIGLRRLGAASSFVVSGIVHEIILWCDSLVYCGQDPALSGLLLRVTLMRNMLNTPPGL
jgi:hypothetical protein